MRIIAITHADKAKGTNPGLTDLGKSQIRDLKPKLPNTGFKNIVTGTGTRFVDIMQALDDIGYFNGKEDIKVSPLLGSADSGENSETGFQALLADGQKIPIGQYIGLIRTPGIDLWVWVKSLKEDTLLCTGREFMGALMEKPKAGTVYIIDTDTMTVTEG